MAVILRSLSLSLGLLLALSPSSAAWAEVVEQAGRAEEIEPLEQIERAEHAEREEQEERSDPREEPAAEEASTLVPPIPRGSIYIPLPQDAPPFEDAVEVEVLLHIDEEGKVLQVELLRGAGPPWDGAVIDAAEAFTFEPARYGGVPIPVEIPFVQRFEPPSREAPEEELSSRLEGMVVEKGTRRPIPFAAVVIEVGEERYRAETDEQGAFRLAAPAGHHRVEVEASGYYRFVVHELLLEGQQTAVRYLVERRSYDPFEVIVVGRAEREEVSRTTLRDREIAQIPGTFGDPFRVVGALPGVGQVFSLLSYPIVRGANPSNTGILIDGVRVPQLFHYLAGPSVIHPAFIDRVDFYPGSFPLDYGGYTGGIVDGITRRARPGERAVDIGLDLTNSSLMLRQPVFGETTATVAGRYGYPGMLLRTFSEDAFASYWDYQARLDGRVGKGRWTTFVFGSYDEVGSVIDGREEANLRSQFHRLDLRYRHGDEGLVGSYAISFGYDQLYAGSNQGILDTWSIEPRLRWELGFGDGIGMRLGLDGSFRDTSSSQPEESTVIETDLEIPGVASRLASVGGFVEAPWWITRDLVMTPGARVDLYDTRSASKASFDPRLLWRYRAAEWDEEATLWFKGGVGQYHQPPRFFIPIPGLDELAIDMGLPASTQTSLGAELALASGYLFELEGYYNYMDPVLLEPNFGGVEEPASPPGIDEPMPPDEVSDAFFEARQGRSYGLELLLRKRDQGRLFGWVAYTLSRSERSTASGWEAFDFDRTHMLHLVAGLKLPRNWEIGGRFQLQTGRPYREDGRIAGRVPAFTRFDLRIDKRAVYKNWMLDFYIDVINVMLAPEPLDQGSGNELRYMLPTIGFRAVL